MGRNNRGFTLIEILVVITIIAALMGMGFVLLRTAGERQDIEVTAVRIQTVRGALNELGNPNGHDLQVPHDMMKLEDPQGARIGARVGVSPPNDTNQGIESVFVALHMKGVNIKTELDEDAFGNTDKDNMSKNETSALKPGLLEIVDEWGNPLAYFYGPDMKNWEKFKRYKMNSGQIEFAEPWRNKVSGEPLQKRTFQLFSAGPDGKFNTEDDIKSWK